MDVESIERVFVLPFDKEIFICGILADAILRYAHITRFYLI